MDTKMEQYRRQTRDARRSILLEWPLWQKRNANNPVDRFKQSGRSEHERISDAIEVVLDLAREGGKHTPLGHGCPECEAMRVVVDYLVDA